MKTVVIKPLGKILKQAGLVSDFQISTALKIQSNDHQLQFGKILVQQGILKQQTVDFFVEQLPKLLQKSQTQPLGYYFQKAALIASSQIETLLEEQKQNGMLLGELALEKGWIKAKTLNFFLQHLGRIEDNPKLKLQFLSPSQQEIIQPFHLESKAAAPYSLIKEVFVWTGGHPLLTQQICQIISDYDDYFIPAGMEVFWIGILVQNSVIDDWKNQRLGEYLKTIENFLLNNENCSTKFLLEAYLKVWYQEDINIDYSQEKQELINLGLIIEQENKLRISNRIYQSIFNPDWIKQQLLVLGNNTKITSNIDKQTSKNTKITDEPFEGTNWKIIVLGLLLISPIFIVFSNSKYQIEKEPNSFDSKEKDSLDSQPLSTSNFCIAPIPTAVDNQEDWRIYLEQEKQRLQKQFPNNCQNNLDKLLVQLNPRNYEFYQNYQQAIVFLNQSDYPRAIEQLYQAAEQAIVLDKSNLLLNEIIDNEKISFKPVFQKPQDWQLLKSILIKAEPNNYQLLYQIAKLEFPTDNNVHHHREFELLFAAAKKAIDNQQAEMMLSQLKQDQKDRFKNLSIGHSEWINLLAALEQNNKQLLD